MGEPDWGLVALAVLCVLAAVGAWLDVRHRRLPNWLCLLIAVAGVIAISLLNLPAWPWSGPVHAAIALIVGMLLFAAGAIGGGDAKFYAALALWFPLRDAPLFIGLTAAAGLIVLLAWFVWRRVGASRPIVIGAKPEFHKLPYGAAIASGAIALALLRWTA